VLCVDRDNDLGKKADIEGPVIGRKAMLSASMRLAIADPEESDANCMFAAVRKFDELRKDFEKLEVACLTGYDKGGFKSDKRINEQLDIVLEKFPAEGFVLVTDGAEDDQVIPILQSRAKIVSKEVIIIKQAHEVESTYYTIKEALKDPFLARIVFGIPGLILLLFVALGAMSLKIIALVLGAYLLLKGLGLEDIIVSQTRGFVSNISIHRISFPFYIGSIFIPIFAALTAYNYFLPGLNEIDLLTNAVQSAQQAYFLLVLTGLSFIIAKSLDVVHLKRAFALRKYFLSAVSIILVWFILDSATQVFLKQADINWFLISIVSSFIILLAAYRASEVFDVRKKITRLLIGLPVYSKEGRVIGKVAAVHAGKESVEIKHLKSKETTLLKRTDFVLREGRLFVSG
jgi:putative membrane protein